VVEEGGKGRFVGLVRRSVKKRRKVGVLLSATHVRKLGRVNIIYTPPLFWDHYDVCRKSNIHPHILLLSLTHITYIVVHLALPLSTSVMTRTSAGHNGDVQLILLNRNVDSIAGSYLDDTGFESKPGDRLLYLRISWSTSVPPGKHCFRLDVFLTVHHELTIY